MSIKVLMVTTEWPTEASPYAAPFVKRQKEKLEELGVEIDVFHFTGGGNPKNYLKAQKQVQQLIKKNNYHLAHAQWGQSVIPLLPKKLPIVITYRGDDLEGVYSNDGSGYGMKSKVLKFVGKNVARYADHTMVVSAHMLDLFKPKSEVDVIPSGIDFNTIPKASKAELKQELGLPTDKKIIIFPNSPQVKRKNYELVKAAFDELSKDREDLMLHVVHGLTHAEILKHLKASDFLFFASFHEGSPNVVKEAIACDTPIIAVPVADVPHRLGKIPGCFVSPDYSVENFVKAAQKGLAYDYSNYSSQANAQELDENVLAQRVMKIYQKVARK